MSRENTRGDPATHPIALLMALLARGEQAGRKHAAALLLLW